MSRFSSCFPWDSGWLLPCQSSEESPTRSAFTSPHKLGCTSVHHKYESQQPIFTPAGHE